MLCQCVCVSEREKGRERESERGCVALMESNGKRWYLSPLGVCSLVKYSLSLSHLSLSFLSSFSLLSLHLFITYFFLSLPQVRYRIFSVCVESYAECFIACFVCYIWLYLPLLCVVLASYAIVFLSLKQAVRVCVCAGLCACACVGLYVCGTLCISMVCFCRSLLCAL